jgi:hypothetical protein
MSKQIVSNETLRVFQEYLVHWSILRVIKDFFEDAGIMPKEDYDPKESSQRRSLVKQYYAACDFSDRDDAQRLLRVFETILISASNDPDIYHRQEIDASVSTLISHMERDGFTFENNRLETIGGRLGLTQIADHADKLDASNLHLQIQRIEEAIESDPELAIGTAKELVETTCKTILQERGMPFEKNWDMMRLVKEVRKVLILTPEDIPDSAKAAKTIKILLNNLATISQGLAELRNSYGTGHGKEGRKASLEPRHA